MGCGTEKMHWSLRHKEYHDHLLKAEYKYKKQFPTIDASWQSQSNSIFVGTYGYPAVKIGILATDTYDHHEDVPFWKENKFKIPDVVSRRIDLVNAKTTHHVKQTSPILEKLQLITLSQNPVDTEVKLQDKPVFGLHTSSETMPFGPQSGMQEVQITSEPKIHHKTERITGDTDLVAKEGMIALTKNTNEHFAAKALSAATLGVQNSRKVVPTRWSITAVDDTVSKNNLETIKSYDNAPNSVYIGSYFGNYCVVVFLDRIWSFELFEMHQSSQNCTTDYESFNGRTNYAEQCAGGYYASRLAVSERLSSLKKQASVIIFRIITDEYEVPLGVWVFREAIRNAMSVKPMEFGSEQLALEYAKAWCRRRLYYDITSKIKASKILSGKKQLQLSEF